jgi:hypothetical protein
VAELGRESRLLCRLLDDAGGGAKFDLLLTNVI